MTTAEDDSLDCEAIASSVVLIGLSFKTAPVRLREMVSDRLIEGNQKLTRSLPHVQESALLSTCNRVEVYLATDEPEAAIENVLSQVLGVSKNTNDAFYVKKNYDAVEHLFRVASGLDSLVVGEDQILQQVREAGNLARISGDTKSILASLFDAAFNVGRRARDFNISSPNRSVGAFALQFALEKLGRQPKGVLLVGTGKTAQLAANGLKGLTIYVASRRKDVQKKFPGSIVVSHQDLTRAARECDLVIAATRHAGYMIKKGDLEDNRSVVLLDLAFPRNIDPQLRTSSSIQLYDLDDIADYARRWSENTPFTEHCERLIRKEAERFTRWLTASKLSPTLAVMYVWAEEIRSGETEMTLRRLQKLSPREKRVVEALSKRLVSKLLAPPTAFAKDSSEELPQAKRLQLLRSLFGVRQEELSASSLNVGSDEQRPLPSCCNGKLIVVRPSVAKG